MIIKNLNIDGFGVFHEFTLGNLGKGINIIQGRNEAGKSTLQKFIKYTLFGYPVRKDQRMPPLNGGQHRGRIFSLMSSGKEIIFERSGGNELTFYDGDASSHDESKWNLLLGNTNEKIFNNIYCFSLDELADVGSLAESGLKDRIFSLGSGLGDVSIAQISKDLQAAADRIYSPRGRNQLIPATTTSISESKKAIAEIQENLEEYNKLTESIAEVEESVLKLNEELKNFRQEKTKLSNYLICYESYILISSAEAELSGLPQAAENYPSDGIQKLDALVSTGKDLQNQLSVLENGDDSTEGVEEIKRTISNISYNPDLLEKAEEVTWLSSNKELYFRSKADEKELSGMILEQDYRISADIKSINAGWIEEHVNGFTATLVHQDRISDFRNKLNEIREKLREAQTYKRAKEESGSKINAVYTITLLSIIIFLGSVPFLYHKLYVPGFICVMASILVFFSRKKITGRNIVSELNEKLHALENDEEKLKTEYGKYLVEEIGVDKELSPEAVIGILSVIARLKEDIKARNRNNEKLAGVKAFIMDFERRADLFRDVVNTSSIPAIENIIAKISSEYDNALKQSDQKAELEKKLMLLERNIERKRQAALSNEEDVRLLIESIGAEDINDFRKKYSINDRVKALTESKKNALNTIEAIAGKGKAREVLDYLASAEPESMRRVLNDLDTVIAEKEEKLNAINIDLGRSRGDLQRIEKGSELALLMTQMEVETQKLNLQYREWLTNRVALRMLEEVKENYERDKQPEVIRKAGAHFDTITEGRFIRIASSLESREITVIDKMNAAKEIAQLSRGTKEQLLVTLRLGYIEVYEKKSEPLPLVVDEIFVNFDPERTRKTAEIFEEFARNRQVIIFTCHPSTADYFKNVNLIEL